MNAVPGIANSYLVSYNSQTLKFTITANLPNTITIRSNGNMLNEMVFSQAQLNKFTVTKTAANACDISGSHYVDSNSIIVKRMNLEEKLEFQILNDRGTFFKIDPNQRYV